MRELVRKMLSRHAEYRWNGEIQQDMIDVNRQGEVWVFAEQHDGRLEDTPLELMSKARHLADTLKVKLAAVLLGDGVAGLGTKLIAHGADKVYLVEHPPSGPIRPTATPR